MRNLTITRTKSFVGCLGKMKVYIEDPCTGDTLISGVNCRKLGTLKNGETVTFPIGEEAARVYVIADQMSRNYANDCYPLEAGAEDVTLTGKNHFNPGVGNPFLFDGVTDETLLANRKKGGRKGILILIIAAIVGFVVGIANPLVNLSARKVQPQDFTVDNMTITLSSLFWETEYEGFTQCYDSKDVGVVILKESAQEYAWLADYTLEEYGSDILWNNDLADSTLIPYQDFLYFTYTAPGTDGATYYYFATVHKNGDTFWMIQFFTQESKIADYEDLFFQWAGSVRFD